MLATRQTLPARASLALQILGQFKKYFSVSLHSARVEAAGHGTVTQSPS